MSIITAKTSARIKAASKFLDIRDELLNVRSLICITNSDTIFIDNAVDTLNKIINRIMSGKEGD